MKATIINEHLASPVDIGNIELPSELMNYLKLGYEIALSPKIVDFTKNEIHFVAKTKSPGMGAPPWMELEDIPNEAPIPRFGDSHLDGGVTAGWDE